jgi:hypothetical protein
MGYFAEGLAIMEALVKADDHDPERRQALDTIRELIRTETIKPPLAEKTSRRGKPSRRAPAKKKKAAKKKK